MAGRTRKSRGIPSDPVSAAHNCADGYAPGLFDIATQKLKRTFHGAIAAWWVLLIIAGYSVFAWFFLGTSCLFASIIGLPCPGCGVTRSFLLLFAGDILGSLRYHPLLIPSVVFMCMYFVSWLLSDRVPRRMEKALVFFVIALMTLYAARMLLMFPHESPMVYNHQAILPRLIGLFS